MADPLLEKVPFIGDLSDKARALFEERASLACATSRQTMLQPGDVVNGAYFFVGGSVRVFYLDEEGHEGTLYTINEGQSCILALNCLFSEMAYPAWAEAGDKGARFFHLDGGTANHLIETDPAFRQAVFAEVSTRLYGLLATLEQAIRLPLKGRLVNLLLGEMGEGNVVEMSQQRIAADLGTSREVVSRLIRSLAGEGLLESNYGRIDIVDADGLRAKIRG